MLYSNFLSLKKASSAVALLMMLLAQSVALAAPPPQTTVKTAPPTDDRTIERVPGTRISIAAPQGFERASSFAGFVDPASNASIMLTEIPAPYSKMSESYQAAPMKAKGMILTASKNESLGALQGMCIEFKQTMYGVPFTKMARLLGDEKCCYLVLATASEDADEALVKKLKDALYSITIDTTASAPSLDEGLSFCIADGATLKKSRRLQNALIFKDCSGATANNQTVLVVAPSIAAIKIDHPDEFAMTRLQNIQTVNQLKIVSQRDITIGGLSGREIKATAREIKSGEPSYIYQVMLFDPNGYYYLVQGLCPLASRKAMDREFGTIASSFKLKKTADKQ